MTSSSSYGQPKASGIWVRCYLPRAGTYEGKQEIANVFAQVEQTLEFTEFTPREMFEQGDTVVVLGMLAGRAKATGKPVKNEWAHVFKFSHGKVRRQATLCRSL
jgi:uncharacterized protein